MMSNQDVVDFMAAKLGFTGKGNQILIIWCNINDKISIPLL